MTDEEKSPDDDGIEEIADEGDATQVEEIADEEETIQVVRDKPIPENEKENVQPSAEAPAAEIPGSDGPAEDIKCPICGKLNPAGSDKCSVCWTNLSVDAETKELTVASPKFQEIYEMIDLDDPMTRKRLEELTMIPGVTKRKALYLYKSGITNLEEFVEKAFHGERRGENFSRMVANKIIVGSMRESNEEASTVTCPSCDSETDADSEACRVCGANLETIDMVEVSQTLGEVANTYLEELSEDEDFAALPEDMRRQMASVLESDSDNVGDISGAVEMLGDEFKELDLMESQTDAAPESGPNEADADGETADEEKPKKKVSPDKKREVLVRKIQGWYEAGYDISGLYELIDGDLETFKTAAKEMIMKGKSEKTG
ncbi:MAG: hypothetical protein KAS67_01425 [Thermoplasmata archaeon]|nr:hypothetical protein [Thermoplasmata archaeon]